MKLRAFLVNARLNMLIVSTVESQFSLINSSVSFCFFKQSKKSVKAFFALFFHVFIKINSLIPKLFFDTLNAID